MYIMCVCLFSALSRRVGALQISIIIIIKTLHIHGSQWRWGLESPQSIKNIASSVQEMCTVSFNCHQNVALGKETIPQSAQKCSHRSPTTKKWKHALLPEPFNHWPLYIIYIYMKSDMGLWCDRHRCIWRDWLKKCEQQCCAAPNNARTGKNNTVHKIRVQKRLKKPLLFIRTKHNMQIFGFSPLSSYKWHLKRRIFQAPDMKTTQLNQKQISVLYISFFTV